MLGLSKAIAAGLALAAMSATSALAGPNPTKYLDPVAFQALGTITQMTSFDAFPTDDVSFPGEPYTVGDLTFDSAQNIILPAGYDAFGTDRNLILSNGGGPFNVSVDQPGYDLFAFKIGNLLGSSEITLHIFTNTGAFAKAVAPTSAADGLLFYGLLAPTGEYFTGFSFSPNDPATTVPGFTDFELGKICGGSTCTPPPLCDKIGGCSPGGTVPEPATWTMLILGFGGVGARLRRRREVSSPA